jgi:hypothetical protein
MTLNTPLLSVEIEAQDEEVAVTKVTAAETPTAEAAAALTTP